MQRTLLGIVLLVLACSSANAALLERVGGQAYYDTDSGLTWVADANLAQTTGYDDDGQTDWYQAMAWIDSLNAAGYLGVNDWRLPAAIDTGTPGCNYAYSGTDCGYNLDPAASELGRMYLGTLGNLSIYDTNGNEPLCSYYYPACLTNTGPFSNLLPGVYWSGTEYTAEPRFLDFVWDFGTAYGLQNISEKSNPNYYSWAVRDGDIAAVPAPATVWLLGTALGAVAWRRRKA